MKKSILVLVAGIILQFLASTAAADTRLFGFTSDMVKPNGGSCWLLSTNISSYSWKAWRWQAVATGTISYFLIHIPQLPVYNDDEFLWAVYEDDNGSVGAIKAYGHYPGYNWSVGDHRFPPTTIGTDLTMRSGTSYWLVAYSTRIDSARTNPSIYTQRGHGECAPNIQIRWGGTNVWTNQSSPPPPGHFSMEINSFHAWSLWESSTVGVPPSPPSNLRLMPIQQPASQ